MSSDNPTKPPVLQKPPTLKYPNAAAAQPPLKPPPKALVIPPSTYPKKRKRRQSRRSCCRTSCCCTVIVILILSVSLLLAGGVFYLWYEPKAPVFHLQSFRFTQFNVSTVDGDDVPYLFVGTESRVELKNPNRKLGLYYGSSEVSIRLPANGGGDDIELGTKTLPGFSQEKRNVTSIKVVTPLSKVALDGGAGEGKRIKSDVKRKVVRVTVEVRTKVGIRVGEKLRMGSVVVNVECKNVELKRIQIDGFMPKCSIRLWDWPINT